MPGTRTTASEPVITAISVARLSDDQLLALLDSRAAERRRLDAELALLAAEADRRSPRDGSRSSLARKDGLRSGVQLVEVRTGTTGRDARALVRVGEVMLAEQVDPAASDVERADAGYAPSSPWLSAVSTAVRSGALSAASAESIRTGLGDPSETVEVAALAAAAVRLVDLAGSVPPDRLAGFARLERDTIDSAGVAQREEARRARRFLEFVPAEDGMTRVRGLLDPESAAKVKGVFDRVTSPRRGGPRFRDAREKRRAQAIVDDARTTGQLTVDAFVALLAVATDADATAGGAILGRAQAGVRIHVTAPALESGAGLATIEGETAAVSLATAERLICEQGAVPVRFDDDGQCVNVGREQRLFTRRQRIGLAARDGGCRGPGCDAPPSWTEAHHIVEWSAGGGTDIADGILLCRFHHLWVHNLGYQIRREGSRYWLDPPPGATNRTPIELPPNPGALHERMSG